MAFQTRSKIRIVDNVTAASTGAQVDLFKAPLGNILTYQATVYAASGVSVTATVIIEVSNDGIGWLSDANSNISLTGTTTATAGYTSTSVWQYVRARVTAISASSTVIVTVGG